MSVGSARCSSPFSHRWIVVIEVPTRSASSAVLNPAANRSHRRSGPPAGSTSSETGETFKFDGYRFEVVDMDGRKIDKLLVSRPRRRRSEEEAENEAPSA